MNCKRVQRLAFLLDSGELSGRRGRGVKKHLESCPACAAFCSDARQLLSVDDASYGRVEGPSPFAMTRIMAHARESVSHKPVIFANPGLQMAVAAMIIVLVAGWWSFRLAGRESPEVRRINDMHAIIAILSDGDVESAGQQAMNEDDMLQRLAEQLLQMEGLSGDDFSEEELWEPQATTPQSHNSPELLSRRRV